MGRVRSSTNSPPAPTSVAHTLAELSGTGLPAHHPAGDSWRPSRSGYLWREKNEPTFLHRLARQPGAAGGKVLPRRSPPRRRLISRASKPVAQGCGVGFACRLGLGPLAALFRAWESQAVGRGHGFAARGLHHLAQLLALLAAASGTQRFGCSACGLGDNARCLEDGHLAAFVPQAQLGALEDSLASWLFAELQPARQLGTRTAGLGWSGFSDRPGAAWPGQQRPAAKNKRWQGEDRDMDLGGVNPTIVGPGLGASPT